MKNKDKIFKNTIGTIGVAILSIIVLAIIALLLLCIFGPRPRLISPGPGRGTGRGTGRGSGSGIGSGSGSDSGIGSGSGEYLKAMVNSTGRLISFDAEEAGALADFEKIFSLETVQVDSTKTNIFKVKDVLGDYVVIYVKIEKKDTNSIFSPMKFETTRFMIKRHRVPDEALKMPITRTRKDNNVFLVRPYFYTIFMNSPIMQPKFIDENQTEITITMNVLNAEERIKIVKKIRTDLINIEEMLSKTKEFSLHKSFGNFKYGLKSSSISGNSTGTGTCTGTCTRTGTCTGTCTATGTCTGTCTGTGTGTISGNSTGRGTCVNNNTSCPSLVSQGFCSNTKYKTYMDNNCCLACSCFDKNASCPAWASKGECTANPGYMIPNCQNSCKLCSGNNFWKIASREQLGCDDMLQLTTETAVNAELVGNYVPIAIYCDKDVLMTLMIKQDVKIKNVALNTLSPVKDIDMNEVMFSDKRTLFHSDFMKDHNNMREGLLDTNNQFIYIIRFMGPGSKILSSYQNKNLINEWSDILIYFETNKSDKKSDNISLGHTTVKVLHKMKKTVKIADTNYTITHISDRRKK